MGTPGGGGTGGGRGLERGEAALFPVEHHGVQREHDAGQGEEDEGLEDGLGAPGFRDPGERAQFSRQGGEGLAEGVGRLGRLRDMFHGSFYI